MNESHSRPRDRGRRWAAGLVAGSAIAALAALGLFGVQNQGLSWVEISEPDPAAVASAQNLSSAFRHASRTVLPAVVTIRTTSGGAELTGDGLPQIPEQFDGLPEEFFKRFFGDEVPRRPQPRSGVPRSRGMGSGVIIDPSGVILTNNHVVRNSSRVIVHLHDGREFEAVEVLTDPKTDIAVVRIEGADDLPAAPIGDSDSLQIGDWVLAVGAPFGLDATVTAGIISAKARGIGIAEREEFLQTDAAINPGNSGGPLVNLRGEVVGINTAISTSGGGNDGVGFAIPINLARWVADQLVETGSVQRAFLGVSIQEVDGELAEQFGLDSVSGALVTEVHPGTPADAAGLQPGDVIVGFNDRQITSPRKLQNVVERAGTTDTHRIVVIRDGEEVTFELTLQPMSESLAAAPTAETPGEIEADEFDSLGLKLSTLTEELAERFETDFAEGGVVIVAVESGSPADRAGLRQGMVIRRVDGAPVSDVEQFRTAVDGVQDDDDLLLLVTSSAGSRFVVLEMS